MKTLVVTFELKNSGFNYEKVVQKVKASCTSWARLTSSSFLIITNLSPETVRNNAMSVFQNGDRIFVSACPVPSAWSGVEDDVSKWILENQPKNS
jgi:hypothetical protein